MTLTCKSAGLAGGQSQRSKQVLVTSRGQLMQSLRNQVREGAGDGGGAAGDLQPGVDVSKWVRTLPSDRPTRAIWALVCPAAE